jgi:release factor glutamine methyltransferase
VILKPETSVPDNHPVLMQSIARRLKHEPVSKIIGSREFYGLAFDVNEHVLDPRPDTETLVDAARKHLERAGKADARILDLCTGSGCILAALLSVFPKATGVAADISHDALIVARGNFRRHALDNRVQIVQSNLLEGVSGRFDIVVCNPPYIRSGDIATLSADVRLHDPLLALDGGDDGLGIYRIVFPQIRNYLSDGGMALFEIGFDQGTDVRKMAEHNGLQVISILRDLGGHERVALVA